MPLCVACKGYGVLACDISLSYHIRRTPPWSFALHPTQTSALFNSVRVSGGFVPTGGLVASHLSLVPHILAALTASPCSFLLPGILSDFRRDLSLEVMDRWPCERTIYLGPRCAYMLIGLHVYWKAHHLPIRAEVIDAETTKPPS